MEEVDLLDYVNTLWRRKWTIISVTALVLIVTAITLAMAPRTYEAKAALLFVDEPGDGFGVQLAQLAGLSLPGGSFVLYGRDKYIQVLKSRTIAENVCARLGLERYGLTYKDLRDGLTLEMPREGGLMVTCEVPTSWLRGHAPDSALEKKTAELSARVANTYLSELRLFDRSNALFVGKKNRLFIERQLDRAQEQLADAEAGLQAFQESHPTLVPPEKSFAYADQALNIVTRQTEAEVALEEARGQLARARSTWDAGAPQDISAEAVMDTPVLSQLRTELAKLEVKRATLLENFTERHPDVVSLDQQIAKTQEEIRSEVARVVSGKAGSASPATQELLRQLVVLEINRDGLEARTSALSRAMSNIEKRLSNLPPEEMRYARLLRNLKAAETVYTTLLAEHAKARITEGRETDNFIVLDDAVMPDRPARPRVKLSLAAALVLGLLGGSLLALIQEGLTGRDGRKH
jgi:uncharacterized protein involved in exopolysaccharide biosynthesis